MYTLRRGEDGRLHGPINKKVFATFGSRKQALEKRRVSIRAVSIFHHYPEKQRGAPKHPSSG